MSDFMFKQKPKRLKHLCCRPPVSGLADLGGRIANSPMLIYKFPCKIKLAMKVNSSVGSSNHNECYTVANETLNAYGKWAGCPGGSGPGYSSTMRYVPNENIPGFGPTIGGSICNCTYMYIPPPSNLRQVTLTLSPGTDGQYMYISLTGTPVTQPSLYGFTIWMITTTVADSTYQITSHPSTISLPISYLVAVGGGPGGIAGTGTHGGGGGSGGVLQNSNATIFGGTSYNITVGNGGTGFQNGENSVVNTNSNIATAIGGGRGGTFNLVTPTNATSGGSGGGGAGGNTPLGVISTTGGVGTTGQGNSGLAGQSGNSGGGGGAGAPGSTNGNGGNGIQSSITGSATYYGGGGAGFNGTGGLGGGGVTNQQGTDGLGGGSGRSTSTTTSLPGGKGIIILRFPTFYSIIPP